MILLCTGSGMRSYRSSILWKGMFSATILAVMSRRVSGLRKPLSDPRWWLPPPTREQHNLFALLDITRLTFPSPHSGTLDCACSLPSTALTADAATNRAHFVYLLHMFCMQPRCRADKSTAARWGKWFPPLCRPPYRRASLSFIITHKVLSLPAIGHGSLCRVLFASAGNLIKIPRRPRRLAPLRLSCFYKLCRYPAAFWITYVFRINS